MRQSRGVSRDSGLSVLASAATGEEKEVLVEVETRESVDSGIGSPSPHTTSKSWGRRAAKQTENFLLQQVMEAAEQLTARSGGELVFTYKPKPHPNLPGYGCNETRLFIPSTGCDRISVSSGPFKQPGFFLKQAMLTEEDVLSNRIPDTCPLPKAFLTNGLAVDLCRIALSNRNNTQSVVRFILNFLDLAVPDLLFFAATNKLMKCLEENLVYVNKCQNLDEAAHFLGGAFQLPEDVIEMTSIMDELDIGLELPHQPEAVTFSEVATTSQVIEAPAVEAVASAEPSLEMGLSPLIDGAAVEYMNQLTDKNTSINEVPFILEESVDQANVAVDHHSTAVMESTVEDENFCYTATVLNLDDDQLERLISAGGNIPPEYNLAMMPDSPEVNDQPPPLTEEQQQHNSKYDLVIMDEYSTPGLQSPDQSNRRSRNRQVPARFKDFI